MSSGTSATPARRSAQGMTTAPSSSTVAKIQQAEVHELPWYSTPARTEPTAPPSSPADSYRPGRARTGDPRLVGTDHGQPAVLTQWDVGGDGQAGVHRAPARASEDAAVGWVTGDGRWQPSAVSRSPPTPTTPHD